MRCLSLTALALLVAASAAQAQARFIVTGFYATLEVSLETGAVRPLARPMGSSGGVAVDGGRFIVSVHAPSEAAPIVEAWDPRTGALLAAVTLPGPAQYFAPALAGDSLHPRAFVWSETTIYVATAAGLTPLVTDVQPPTSVSAALPRLLAYAPVSRTLFVVRVNGGAMELASFTDAGVPIDAIPLAAEALGLAVTSDGTSAFVVVAPPAIPATTVEARRYDCRTGTLAHTASLPVSIAARDHDIDVDESRHRVTFTSRGTGLFAFTYDLTPLQAFPSHVLSPSGVCRFEAAFDERSGALVAATTAFPYPYSPVPRPAVVTAVDVATGAVLGRVVLNPSPDSTSGAPICGGGSILLTPPAAPSLAPAVVTGTTVTLAWARVANATDYRVEAYAGPGAPVLTTLTNAATFLTVHDVPPGTYTVRVRGINDSGPGVLSAPIAVTVP